MNGWINWPLLSNPANWVIIVLVLIFLSYSAFIISSSAGWFPLPQIQVKGS